jgi:MerR family transcriptional regulator, light-induced transcriptional regulator
MKLPWVRARRRLSDRQLAASARASSLITCEYPRDISDIIGQLPAFEDYCDSCVSRAAEDVMLHRHLGDVTNHAPQMFGECTRATGRNRGFADGPTSKPTDRSCLLDGRRRY